MRKQSGRWAGFFEQMGDQSVHLFEGEARVMNTPPICSKKLVFPEGASDPFARWHSARLAAAVTKLGMNPRTSSGQTENA